QSSSSSSSINVSKLSRGRISVGRRTILPPGAGKTGELLACPCGPVERNRGVNGWNAPLILPFSPEEKEQHSHIAPGLFPPPFSAAPCDKRGTWRRNRAHRRQGRGRWCRKTSWAK